MSVKASIAIGILLGLVSGEPQSGASAIDSLVFYMAPAWAQSAVKGAGFSNTKSTVSSGTFYDQKDTNTCGFGPLNAQSWRSSNIDSWLAAKAAGSTRAGNLSTGLRQQYAPNLAQSVSSCDISSLCSPVSCELVDLKQKDAKEAFFVLEAIANFNNFLKRVVDGIVAAQTLVNSFTADLVQQFSTAEYLEQRTKQRRDFIGFLGGLLSVVFSIFGIPGAVAGAASNVIALKVAASVKDPPDRFSVAASIGFYIGAISNASTTAVRDLGQDLLSGRADPQGNSLWQYLANGSFAEPSRAKSTDVETFLGKQWVAAGLNAIWTSQRTYIAAGPTKDGVACKDDKRGPYQSKLCLDQHKDYVYYAYYIPPTTSSETVYPQTLLPQDYDKLSKYPGLDIKSIMTASVLAYDIAKFDYNSIRQQRWIEVLKNTTLPNASAPLDLGYAFEGTFTLPVCFNPWGGSFSQAKTDTDRRYPCQCFDPIFINATKPTSNNPLPTVDPGSTSTMNNNLVRQETTDFLYAAGLNQSKVWFGFCNDGKKGNRCSDIRGTSSGRLVVERQNNTFGYCAAT